LKNEPKSVNTVVSSSIYASSNANGSFNANVIITTTNNSNAKSLVSPGPVSVSGTSGGSNKNRRCPLHSLDKAKLKSINDWLPVWHSFMNEECRAKFILIDTSSLLITLHNYLRKHKFCSDCKLNVMRAYNLLVGELDPSHEKGFCASMYDGLQCCSLVPCESASGESSVSQCCSHDTQCDSSRYHLTRRHLHLKNTKEFVGNLIFKAELEIHGR
jgi:hypothetical protein